MWDIYVSLNNKIEDRFLIEITKKTTLEILCDRIKVSLEERYEHLKGLRGLKVNELKLHQKEKGSLRGASTRDESSGKISRAESLNKQSSTEFEFQNN